MWSVCRLSQWWLVFILLGVDAAVGDGCMIWEKFKPSEMSRLLLENVISMYMFLRDGTLCSSYDYVIPFRRMPVRFLWVANFFDSRFMKLVFRSSEDIKF